MLMFPSPCGVMVVKQKLLQVLLGFRNFKVSVPLRGNGRETRQKPVMVATMSWEFPSPCGVMVVKLVTQPVTPATRDDVVSVPLRGNGRETLLVQEMFGTQLIQRFRPLAG